MAVGTESRRKSEPDGGPYRMPAAVFLRAVEADVFPAEERVFLRDGRIQTKTAKKLPHAVASETLRAALTPVLPEGWGFWAENPIFTDDFSAPLPDLCIVRGRAQDYYARNAFPRAEDVALVVEIADRSLRENRTGSLADYAGAGVPVYWIVNLVDWQVEVYSEPRTVEGDAGYSRRDDYPVGREVPLTIGGVEFARVPAGHILPGERRLSP